MNKLPDLPQIKEQREAVFSNGIFRKWIEENPRSSSSLEFKHTLGKNELPFSEVGNDQIAWGMSVKGDKGVLIRIDGKTGQPDYIYARNMSAYFVIRYPKCFVIIDVETFALEKKRSKRRSLACGRAKELSIITVEL